MTPRRWLGMAGLAACAALLLFAVSVVLRYPCLGVADNLDYWRVMRPAGISHVQPVDPPGQFVACRYTLGPSQLGELLSSPALIAYVARGLNWNPRETGPDRMDLRQVGLVYLLLTIAIVAAALWRRTPSWLVAGLAFALVDPGYLLFFNSFYADAALFVALFGAIAWFASLPRDGEGVSRVSWPAAASLAGLAVLGGWAKMQFVVFPAVVLLALVAWLALGARRRWAAPAIAASVLVAAMVPAAPWHFYQGPAPRFLEVNNYHAVYAGILQASSDAPRALGALGIDQQFVDLPRSDVWSGNVPLDHAVFQPLKSLSRWRLLRLYASDPAALAFVAARVEEVFGATGAHLRGNFSRASGRPRPYAQYTVAWQFSRWRGWVFSRWPRVLWLVLAAALAWLGAGALRRRWNGLHSAGLLLTAFAGAQFVVAVLGDGFVSLEQHLLGARLAVDLLVVLLVHAACAALVSRYSTASAFIRNA